MNTFSREYNYEDINIDKLNIFRTNMKSSNYMQNEDSGDNFEESLSLKSIIKLPIYSINDEDNIYTRQYRHFFGLKVIVTNKHYHAEVKNVLDEGKFKVIPFSNNFFLLKINNYLDYYISYNAEVSK